MLFTSNLLTAVKKIYDKITNFIEAKLKRKELRIHDKGMKDDQIVLTKLLIGRHEKRYLKI